MTMHYAPFKVAETFKTLAALYPDRIDLGMGRSPGGSPLTTLALNNGQPPQLDQFDKLPEILLFLRENFLKIIYILKFQLFRGKFYYHNLGY